MMDSDGNRKTIQSYENNIQAYFDRTPAQASGQVKAWIDQALASADKNLPVLELGSGPGRDADYIESNGFTVKRTDATVGFVEALRSAGHDAEVINALTDDFGGQFGMIFADAVLLHFTPEQLADVLRKSYEALPPGGILAATFKKGKGSEWKTAKLDAPRYFQYWSAKPLSELVYQAGFELLSLDEWLSPRTNTFWLHLIARAPKK